MRNRQLPVEKPLVSVIVPTRNSEGTLGACLSSIGSQTYQLLEVIVVDNDSSDGTPDVAREHNCVLLSVGPERSAQRNHGVRHARGSYLLFIDSDMILEARVVEEAVAAAGSGATAVIIPEASFGEGFWARCKALERSCYVGDPSIEAARFFKRDVFEEVGGYDEDLTGTEDWDLHERALRVGARLARTRALIRHDEGRLQLLELMRRKFYYGRTLALYVDKHRTSAGVQLRLVRPAFIRHRRRLAHDPVTAVGMVVMKISETAAGAAGMLAAKFR